MSKNEEKSLVTYIKQLTDRITALENSQNTDSKPFYQSLKYPSHYLEASSKMMTENGLTTETAVPICALCHSPVSDTTYSLCHHCERVICETCVILHNNRVHCEECLRLNHLDLSKRQYLGLICAANNITGREDINNLTAILPQDIKKSMERLRLSNLITSETRLFGLLQETKLTDEGMIAINTYRQVYGKHEDVSTFGRKLRAFLSENNEV